MVRTSQGAVDTAVVWFRRDLRLADNGALADAVAGADRVVPLFVVDPVLWKPAGAPRRSFLVDALVHLDAGAAGHLVVRSGPPAEVVPALAREVGAGAVHVSADFGPYGSRRDGQVAAALGEHGVRFERGDTPYAVAPGRVRKTDGEPFKVFTPFYRAWSRLARDEPRPRPARVLWARGVPSDGLPEPPRGDADLPTAGEDAAHRRLDRFLEHGLADYADHRDEPAGDTTSRLSPYLRWGCLHPRQVLDRLDGSRSAEKLRSEVAWREFYAHVLHAWPGSARRAFRPKLAAIRLDEGEEADARFAAWVEGRTGYPIVDAGMRQLAAEGWVHNRVRMLVASFLVKDLHVDWTRGARLFMERLVDGDLASNNHGWQWVAGTGTDAAPYFRIFNPTTQAERFDPDGAYVRRWVPELADLPASEVHRPWDRPDGPPPGYPEPLVDHAAERDEALARFQALA